MLDFHTISMFYVVIAGFYWFFNMLWMIKEKLSWNRFVKYTLLAVVWPYQFFLQFTNRGI